MKKLAFAAALAALAIAVPLSSGSSHREAPLISMDPTGDNTDVYAFTADDAPGKLTIVANWIPFEDPAGGPNFYRFDDSAHYYLNVDNNGDGVADVRYLFDFRTKIRNKKSFLYGLGGPVTSLADPDLNVIQRYTLTREKLRHGKVVSRKVLGKGLPTPPNNVGPKTTPNYEATAMQAVKSLPGGVKVFAGQRDDPFYASLGRIFDTINLTGAGLGNMGGGVDDLAGYAVHSTVLQVPEGAVTRNGKPVAGPDAHNAVVGVWSTTERRSLKVARRGHSRYRQISRLGNPLVNEVVIPLGQKDRFNRTTPDRDAELYGKYVVKPELAAVLNALFSVGAPENNRTDIVQAVLQGLPGSQRVPRQGRQERDRHAEDQPGHAACGQPEAPRRARGGHRRLPERAASGRRRGRHRPPGRRRCPEGEQRPARGRGGSEQRSVPDLVPVRGAAPPGREPGCRLRLAAEDVRRAERARHGARLRRAGDGSATVAAPRPRRHRGRRERRRRRPLGPDRRPAASR